jgi:hypothetical protein
MTTAVNAQSDFINKHTRLCVVDSYVFPHEADMVRLILEHEGVPARVVQAASAGWFWHYSNAFGGAQVLVAERDLRQAIRILRSRRRKISARKRDDASDAAKWNCPNCGKPVPAGWDVCWSCGTSKDGQTDAEFVTAAAPAVEYRAEESPPIWWPMVCILCPPFLLYELFIQYLLRIPKLKERRIRSSEQFQPLSRRMTRACRLAVFAILWLAPLAFFSLWILGSMVNGTKEMSRRDRRFARMVLAINLLYSVPYMLLWLYFLFSYGL